MRLPRMKQLRVMSLAAIFCLQAAAAFAAAEGTFQRTLKVGPGTSVDIESGAGNVEVQRGNAGEVQITGRIRASNWWGSGSSSGAEEKIKRLQDNPPIQQSGSFVRIGHIDDPELRRNISISYTVIVPADTRLRSRTGSGNQTVRNLDEPVDVQAGSGNITLTDIGDTVRAEAGSGNITIERVKGNVRAHSGSGTIEAMDIAGGFEANAGSGNISLRQTASGAVRVDTGSGEIELSRVRGSLEAKAGSGNIRADGAPTGSWMLHTGSGEVTLRLASNAGFDLHAQTGSGSISLATPVSVEGKIERKEVRGKVRGGGVPVEVETGSGGIRIE